MFKVQQEEMLYNIRHLFIISQKHIYFPLLSIQAKALFRKVMESQPNLNQERFL